MLVICLHGSLKSYKEKWTDKWVIGLVDEQVNEGGGLMDGIAWLGHRERMEEYWINKKIVEWKLIAVRPRGKPEMEWADDVKQDIKVVKFYRLAKQAGIRKEQKWIIEQVKTRKELLC
jgi:hypothetical protein